MLDSPSEDKHDVPSQSSHLLPEYENLYISVLMRIKIIQEKNKKRNGTPKVFWLIAFFVSVAMYATKSILPEIAIFQPYWSTMKKYASTLQTIYPTSLTTRLPT